MKIRNWLKYSLFLILVLVIGFVAFASITGRTYLYKAVLYNFADIDDFKIFDNDQVQNGEGVPISESSVYNQSQMPEKLQNLHSSSGSVAFLVLKSDSVLFEKYWDGHSDSSISASFSVAKSITSILIGVAIKESLIHSVNDKVGLYLPEFNSGLKKELTIKDLLTMSSGSDWDESYANPFSVTTELYYGTDAYKTATSVSIVHKPGTLHVYKSGDTQLLGLILEKVTGKSLAEYASEKLWKPLGALKSASWSTDRKGGHVKAYCCFNTNARDFSRIGTLMLHKGIWNQKAVIDSSYWAASVTPCNIKDASGAECKYYGYQWWIVPGEEQVFMAWGILGQFIIVIPSKEIVVVRLGKTEGPLGEGGFPELVYEMIDWAKKQG